MKLGAGPVEETSFTKVKGAKKDNTPKMKSNTKLNTSQSGTKKNATPSNAVILKNSFDVLREEGAQKNGPGL